MLKIERHREISLHLFPSEKLLTRTFWIALGIAIGFHLLFFLCFKVKTLVFPDQGHALSPAQVQIEAPKLTESSKQTVALIEQEKSPWRGIPEPKSSIPSFPSTQSVSSPVSLELANASPLHPFSQIETKTPDLISSHQIHTSPQLYLSGELSLDDLIDTGLKSLPSEPQRQETYVLRYSIKVDQQRGQIFWFEPLHNPYNPSIEKQAEKVLTQIKFKRKNTGFISSGEIEMVLPL